MIPILQQIESKPFSEHELLTLVDNKANLVLYPDLANYHSIDQLLRPHGAAIILYITRSNGNNFYGHWTCIFKIDNHTLEWFDPYGLPPDLELRMTNHKYPPYLLKLIDHSPYHVIYNTHRLQDITNRNMSTCGRHVGMRLHFRDLPISSYARLMNSVPGLSSDNLVSLLTAFIKS